MTATAAPPCYLFGVVPADEAGALSDAISPLRATPGETGIGAVRLVGHGELVAVIGSTPPDRPLGRAADLRAHDQVLTDIVAARVSVLPFRFGTVLANEQAVSEELLAQQGDSIAQALRTVRGRVQYTVTARYEQDTALREVLAAHPEIASLRSRGGDAELNRQLRLGELVVRALEQMRPQDAATLTARLEPLAAQTQTFEPAAPDAVLRLAALVDRDGAERFEQAAEDCARASAGRMRLRLVGPVAPYDFVDGA